MTDDPQVGNTLPDGEYAIVELLGHRTLVGRIAEAERFGTKMCAIEPVYRDALLPALFVGGASIYALTPCSRAVAWARRHREAHYLPEAVRHTMPAALLAAEGGAMTRHLFEPDEEERPDEP